MKPAGYLLPCQRQWLTYHMTHGHGGCAVYCRGPGGPMRNVPIGAPVFCVMSKNRPHHVYMRGSFGGYEVVPLDGAFDRFDTAVGAPDRAAWQALVSALPNLRGGTTMGAIMLDDVHVLETPLPIDEFAIGLNNSPKGRGLLPGEVARLQSAMEQRRGAEAPYVPTGTDTRRRVRRQIAERQGQDEFRESAIARYGARCLLSGCTLVDALQAAHINPYRSANDHHPANSLLLRSDLHRLYDLDLLGIHPTTLVAQFHPDARGHGYEDFERMLDVRGTHWPSEAALRLRWDVFCEKLAKLERRRARQGRARRAREIRPGNCLPA